jgi:hypothetical protein
MKLGSEQSLQTWAILTAINEDLSEMTATVQPTLDSIFKKTGDSQSSTSELLQ